MAQAPSINRITLENKAANYIHISWENLGGLFTYTLQRKLVASPVGSPEWVELVTGTTDVDYWDEGLTASSTYQYRIIVSADSYTDSDPFDSDEITTFATNSFTIFSKDSVEFYDEFITQKFTNGSNYIDFNNDDIEIALVNEEFELNKSDKLLTDLAGDLLTVQERQVNHGDVPSGCKGMTHLMPYYFNDHIFIFERGQTKITISNDGGKTWFADQAIDRVGVPVGDICCVPLGNKLLIMGYNYIYSIDVSNKITVNTDIDELMQIEANYPVNINPGEVDSIAINDQHLIILSWNYFAFYDHTIPKTGSPEDVTWNSILSPMNVALPWHADSTIKVKTAYGMDGFNVGGSPGLHGFVFYVPGQWNNQTGQFEWEANATNIYLADLDLLVVSALTDPYLLNRSYHPQYSNLGKRAANDFFLSNVLNDTFVSYSITSPNGVEYTQPTALVTGLEYPSSSRPTSGVLAHTVATGSFYDIEFQKYRYEDQYIWCPGDYRIRIDDRQKIFIIHPEETYEQLLTNVSESFDSGELSVYADPVVFDNFSGKSIGAVFYKQSTGELIGFNSSPIVLTERADFSWSNGIVVKGILQTISVVEEQTKKIFTEPRDIIRDLAPMYVKYLPQYDINKEPLYAEFVRLYLQYISQNSCENYGMLHNLLRQHDVNETEFLELFENDLIRRNVLASSDKKDELIKFVNNHAHEIYSIKGVEDSYKFMFKLLYNVDVNITLESEYDYVYEIDFGIKEINGIPAYNYTQDELDTFAASFLGNVVTNYFVGDEFTSNEPGRADIVRVVFKELTDEDSFPSSKQMAVYTISLANIYGDFELNKDYRVLNDDLSRIEALSEINIVDINISDDQYLDDDVTFSFPLRVEVDLPRSKYRDDIIRFVHPAGFGFVGVYLITSFINSGVTFDHLETIIDFYEGVHWDSGIPSVYPTEVPDLAGSPLDYQYYGSPPDPSNGIVMKAEPNGLGGLAFPASTSPVRPEETLYGVGGAQYAIDEPDPSPLLYGLTQLERRKPNSPLFSSSWGRFFDRLKLPSLRLKDNDPVGSPEESTQLKETK